MRASEEYRTIDIPTETFNKVWIVPSQASVHIRDTSVFVSEAYLGVMLEEDYLALEMNQDRDDHGLGNVEESDLRQWSPVVKEVVREVIIPAIEKEVNEGKTFANLRQIYNSMLLATWYKRNLKKSYLGQLYFDRNKVEGIRPSDQTSAIGDQKETLISDHRSQISAIYDRYVESFKVGVYDYIEEEYDHTTQQIIPKKYFLGGLKDFDSDKAILVEGDFDMAELADDSIVKVKNIEFDKAQLNSDQSVVWTAFSLILVPALFFIWLSNSTENQLQEDWNLINGERYLNQINDFWKTDNKKALDSLVVEFEKYVNSNEDNSDIKYGKHYYEMFVLMTQFYSQGGDDVQNDLNEMLELFSSSEKLAQLKSSELMQQYIKFEALMNRVQTMEDYFSEFEFNRSLGVYPTSFGKSFREVRGKVRSLQKSYTEVRKVFGPFSDEVESQIKSYLTKSNSEYQQFLKDFNLLKKYETQKAKELIQKTHFLIEKNIKLKKEELETSILSKTLSATTALAIEENNKEIKKN